MWDFGLSVAAAAALVSATPVAPPPLPDLRDLTSEPCILPISAELTDCPDLDRRPLVSCVLPVTGRDLPGGVEPDCPDWAPAPRGRAVPISP